MRGQGLSRTSSPTNPIKGAGRRTLTPPLQPYTGDRRLLQGTFDNGATFGELRFLAARTTPPGMSTTRTRSRKVLIMSFEPGIPREAGPSSILRARAIIATSRSMMGQWSTSLNSSAMWPDSVDFSFVDEARRSAAEQGFGSGIQCILKCQIKVNGKLTIWCAQHDETTLEPRWGRSFEPPHSPAPRVRGSCVCS